MSYEDSSLPIKQLLSQLDYIQPVYAMDPGSNPTPTQVNMWIEFQSLLDHEDFLAYLWMTEKSVRFQKISQKKRERRTRFTWHCARSDEPVSKMVCWILKHGKKKPGRPVLTYMYIDILKEDTGLEAADFKTAMQDRNLWKAIVVRENHPP